MKTVWVTGAAGFIGYHTAKQLLDNGCRVIGLDNMNDYYSVSLKEARLAELAPNDNFIFREVDLADRAAVAREMAAYTPDAIVHLAAQAGVRYSLHHANAYIRSNIDGFVNLLECCRDYQIEHFLYASSSSVYGHNKETPHSVDHAVDHPVSLYAATKKANELIAHTYSHLFGIPTTGLRFFTVYGPWGRPDMAYYQFTKSIIEGIPITLYNHGQMKRDFTYIDDVVEAVVKLLGHPPQRGAVPHDAPLTPGTAHAPYRVYNIGNQNPVDLGEFVATLERHIGIDAIIQYDSMQPGDVYETCADTQPLKEAIGYQPSTSLEVGLGRFVKWFLENENTKQELNAESNAESNAS